MRWLVVAAVAALIVAVPGRAAVPPRVQASAYLIETANDGVLAGAHAHQRLPVASITKLMTVLVALEHHRLGDVVSVDARAAAVGESTADLEPGERLSVSDLVKAALIQSANDAADALALSVEPSFDDFARLMNTKARALGLHDTHFVRPDGLDAPDEYSSAADVTRLAMVLMRNPFVRATVREETDTIGGGRVLHTWDDLLEEVPGVFGVKTGHTGAAGWCQVAAIRGPGGAIVYATILGSPSRATRNADLASLLRFGESQFRVVEPVVRGRTYAQAALPYGESPLPLVAAASLRLTARVGVPLTERIVGPLTVGLPVRRGATLGRIEIWSGGKLRGERRLVAGRTAARPGAVRRLGWYAGRAVHHVAQLILP